MATKKFVLCSCGQPCGITPVQSWRSARGATSVRKKRQTACKPGSVRHLTKRDDHSSGTHLTMRLTRPTRTAGRERPRDHHRFAALISQPPLFGLAPGGVYRTTPVARGVVRSCRTVSPLPAGSAGLRRRDLARAVCFLWHCPWGRPRRRLAGTVFPWSPDFPPPRGLPPQQRPSSCLASAHVRPRNRPVKRPLTTQLRHHPEQ